MKKARHTGKFILAFSAVFLVMAVSGGAYAQIKDSLSVTWYESYDGFYDYVHEGPGLSDIGRIVLIVAIVAATYVVYRRWQLSRHRVAR
jgi:Mn2+/Fe2+ NRAMP family transporter